MSIGRDYGEVTVVMVPVPKMPRRPTVGMLRWKRAGTDSSLGLDVPRLGNPLGRGGWAVGAWLMDLEAPPAAALQKN